jgi:hypothetical protein
MPTWGTVSMIDPSPHAPGRAYIAVDGHQENIRDPYLFKTTDYGETWENLSVGIPKSVLSYTSAIKEDPVREGLLYAGTANGIYVSFDDGESWQDLQFDLPRATITWIAFQEHFNDLVVSTNGRGIWILDDVTPLQQLTQEVGRGSGGEAQAHLFEPRRAYRFKRRQATDSLPNDQSDPDRVPYGASINYFLSDDVDGETDVTLEILDGSDQLIRTLQTPKKKGLNRVWWDLRHEPLRDIELRTTPSFHPHVWEEKRFRGQDTRPVLHWGIGAPQQGVLAAPGTYTVKLLVGEHEYTSQLEVVKDPSSEGTDGDIREMVDLWLSVADDINDVVDMINRLEWVGKQLEDLADVLGGLAGDEGKALAGGLSDLSANLMAVEDKLLQRQLHASDPKSYREEMMLYSKLLWFSGDIGTGAGDIRNTQDLGPTRQQLEVYDLLKGRLADVRAEYETLMNETIPAFNGELRAAGHGTLITDGGGSP